MKNINYNQLVLILKGDCVRRVLRGRHRVPLHLPFGPDRHQGHDGAVGAGIHVLQEGAKDSAMNEHNSLFRDITTKGL